MFTLVLLERTLATFFKITKYLATMDDDCNNDNECLLQCSQ